MLWWTDDLETGIFSIDEQHRKMFDRANEIFDLGIEEDVEEVKKIFIFLMDYSNNHFYDEEKWMIKEEYEDFIEHREEHNFFIERIYEIYQDIINDEITESLLNDLKVLIIDWLANHINVSDRNFIKSTKHKKNN